MNPKRKLLDFEIFRQANSGDPAAIDAVVQYHRKDFDGYLGKSPDEIDIKLNNELICAFRKAIQKYKIKPGDTNYSYTELLDIAYDILETEDTDLDKF